MGKKKSGDKFGFVTLISVDSYFLQGTNKKKRAIWNCLCDCGNTLKVQAPSLHPTISCKSCKSTRWEDYKSKHVQKPRTKLRGVYDHMVARCYVPSSEGYDNYGGRGITVCDR